MGKGKSIILLWRICLRLFFFKSYSSVLWFLHAWLAVYGTVYEYTTSIAVSCMVVHGALYQWPHFLPWHSLAGSARDCHNHVAASVCMRHVRAHAPTKKHTSSLTRVQVSVGSQSGGIEQLCLFHEFVCLTSRLCSSLSWIKELFIFHEFVSHFFLVVESQ